MVDDEPAIRALVAKIVERAGFPVDSARDGADAIEQLEAREYAVVVVDLMMPNIDGFELIDYLKRRTSERPAVIVISAGDPGAFRQLDGAMVHSIVRKPFDIDVLGDLITAAVKAAEEAPETAASGDVLPFPQNGHVC